MPTDATPVLSFIAGFLLVPERCQLSPGPGTWDSPLVGFSVHVLATRSEMARKGAPSRGMPGPAGPQGRSAVWQEEQPLGISKFAVLQSDGKKKKNLHDPEWKNQESSLSPSLALI